MRRPLNLVAIGGGTGLSTLLRGWKGRLGSPDAEIEVTAIVTVTDDGRSSGRLREEFGVLPPGDIRNCLEALAEEERSLTRVFGYRFPGDGPLGGHSLGNLLLLALSQTDGGFLEAIEAARDMLGVKARIFPSTLTPVTLVARIGSGEVHGQVAIKASEGPIEKLHLVPEDAPALPAAIEALLAADIITLGPGSLFTSIIANLLVSDLAAALTRSRARRVYICNALSEYDETHGLSAVDHVRTLLSAVPGLRLDDALFNSAPISAEMRRRYAEERAVALEPPSSTPSDLAGTKFISLPLITESDKVRHDPHLLREAISSLIRQRN